MERSVTHIPARQVRTRGRQAVVEEKKIRVAAYCRVSTDEAEQLNSFENQVEYYTRYIQSNPKYEMVDIYADEGISGTNVRKRKAFLRMIEDCEAKKIDLVIVKSISRFARNTQDCLSYSRKLKNLGIGIIFEKENINTLDATGELLFTILSSLAQDESRNISENCKWGIRSKFQEGKPHVNTAKFTGFDMAPNGYLVINEKEAEIVKRVFREFIEGSSICAIAKGLNADNVPGVSGEAKWSRGTIEGMLEQEKYMGDSLLQKWVTTDYLNKTQRRNNGIVDQYYIKDSHEAIIDKETWYAVQQELQRRKNYRKEHGVKNLSYGADQYPFSGKIICQHCNSAFRRMQWKNRNVLYYTCKNTGCSDKITEDAIEKVFISAWNQVVKDRKKYKAHWDALKKDGTELEKIRAKQMIAVTNEGMIKGMIAELVLLVLEKIVVLDKNHFRVCFLEGTEIEIEL